MTELEECLMIIMIHSALLWGQAAVFGLFIMGSIDLLRTVGYAPVGNCWTICDSCAPPQKPKSHAPVEECRKKIRRGNQEPKGQKTKLKNLNTNHGIGYVWSLRLDYGG